MAQPAAAAAAGAESTARPAGPPLGQLLKSLLDDIPGLISDRVHLAALELKRARRALTQLVGMLVAAAILAATAWVALWGLLITWAVVYGLPWWAVGLGVLLINVVGGWLALRRARAQVEFLTLPATLRRLTIAPSPSHGAAAEPPPAVATAAAVSPVSAASPGAERP